jgi:hypothetical protein
MNTVNTIGRVFRPLLFSCSFFLFVAHLNSQVIAQTGAIDNEFESSNEKKLTVWVAPAEQKVRSDDRIERDNLIWSEKDKKIAVAGAGNEHVPFQVVITTSVKGSPREVKVPDGFMIEISDLTSAQGNKIRKENINCYLEHYIMLFATSSSVGATGYWPDAIVPIKKTFSMAAQYDIVKNRPIWVDMFIPSGTKAGEYSGNIDVTQHGELVQKLQLAVKVYDFSLPDETSLITYMNVSKDQLAHFYHQPSNTEEITDITQVYYDKLFANRMEPWFNDMLRPDIELKDNKVKVTFDHDRYLYYMNTLKTKRVLLNALPGNLNRLMTAQPFSDEYNKIVKSYLSQVEAYFNKNKWHDRLVFNSPIDEPRSLEDYENTRKWGTLVKEATTNVPFLVTRTPVFPKDHPEWGSLQGYVTNYSIHGNHLNDPLVKQAILDEKSRGGEITWYISCDQRFPQPNYFIDAPAMDLVMVPWITSRYKMDGILYWAINWWSETANPWLNANTFHSGFLCSDGSVLNGEGSLWYPGDYVERYTGQPNVCGPVSSIRFELLREGIEDYEYLSMLGALGDKEFATEQVKNLVVDVKAFSRNVADLYSTRKAMAERIEELLKKHK